MATKFNFSEIRYEIRKTKNQKTKIIYTTKAVEGDSNETYKLEKEARKQFKKILQDKQLKDYHEIAHKINQYTEIGLYRIIGKTRNKTFYETHKFPIWRGFIKK